MLYNKKGQPYFYNLDLMHRQLPKLDFSEEIYVVFTASASTVDEEVVQPAMLSGSQNEISIIKGSEKFTFEIDLDNTVSVLKYKIFKATRIHPLNQIVKFATKPLSNNV